MTIPSVDPTTFCTPPPTLNQNTNFPAEEVFWLLCQPVMRPPPSLFTQYEATPANGVFKDQKRLKSLGAKLVTMVEGVTHEVLNYGFFSRYVMKRLEFLSGCAILTL
jgi:hypothetical protein